jgi:hypothetical protein
VDAGVQGALGRLVRKKRAKQNLTDGSFNVEAEAAAPNCADT